MLVHKPNGQVNSIIIGKVGVGVWHYPIGPAGSPAGQRIVMLMSGSTVLFTTFYNVVEPSTPIPTTTSQTIVQYQTLTVPTTITQFSTIKITEVNTKTVFSTITLPPPMDLIYVSFIVIAALIIAILFLIARTLRRSP